jgi:hypothetical protein
MDKESWRQAWGLFMTDPIPFGSVLFVVACFVGGGLWYLRGFIAKSHVATLEVHIRTLEERLRLAEDEQGKIAKEIERLESKNANQAGIINGLKNNLPPRQLQALATGTSAIAGSISDLSRANTELGATLTIIGDGFRVLLKKD